MGEVDFGFLAVPAGAPGVPDAQLYAGLRDGCRFHRELGYRTAWLIEHHFSDYYPCPSPVVSMAYIASAFPDLSLGTCVLVAPWHDPLRLAGELAMLTNMTSQQLYIGLGRGTAKYEYDAFGIEMGEARERFKEVWEILDLAMCGEPFTYGGVHLTVDTPVRLRPDPVRERIDFFGAIGSFSSTAVMAELGLAPMCTSFGVQTAELLPAWEQRAAEVGSLDAVATLRPLLVNTVVAETDDEAIAEAQVYMTRYMQAQIDHYDAFTVDMAGVKGYEAWAATFERWKVLTDPESIIPWTEGQLIGSPETVAERVQFFVDAGFNHLIPQTVVPGTPREVQRRWAERFAREVAPHFSSAFTSQGAR
jgi:alkanesulfonate monooxygenase SsuD/methylene tetrahydromethanopterin reductase-like flavin-dependent oxidoreductase (luciferase family)